MVSVTGLLSGTKPYIRLGGRNVFGSVSYGSLALSPALSEGDLYRREVKKFGFLHHGMRVFGALRDKEVVHFNATGDITVSSPMSGSDPPPNVNSFGRMVELGGVDWLISGLTSWGLPLDTSHSFERETEWNPYIERLMVTEPYQMYQSLKFYGPVGIFLERVDPYDVHLDSITGTVWSSQAPLAKLIVLCYDAEAQLIYRSQEYTSVFAEGHHTFAINGDVIELEDIWERVGDVLGVDVSPDAGEYSAQIASHEIIETVDTIIETLTSPELRRYVWATMVAPWNPHSEMEWGDFTQDLIKQQKYVDSSLLLTMFELTEVEGLFKSLGNWSNMIDFFKNLNPGASLKSLRKLFIKASGETTSNALAVQFGVLPTVTDFQGICAGWNRFLEISRGFSRFHVRRTIELASALDAPISSTFVLTAEVTKLPTDATGTLMQSIQDLKKKGLYPSLTMIWDAVPLSFLVNGVLDLKSILEDLDTRIDVEYFPISYCMLSAKRSWSPAPTRIWPLPGVSGTVTFSHYDRRITESLPLPPPQIDEPDAKLRHFVSSGMIAVQRLT